MTYGFLPFAILPLFVSIDRLDDSLVAAARDLYASGRAAFRHVTLPLTMPGIIAAAILTFIPSIGDFVTPDILGGAETTTIAKIIQSQFLGARDWPAGAALGFLLMAVTIVALAGASSGRCAARCSADEVRRYASATRSLTGYALLVYAFLFAPDRHPHRLQLQRLRGQLRVDGLHARLVPDAVRQRGHARRALEDARGGLRRGRRLDRPGDIPRPGPRPAANALRRRHRRDAHPAADGRARRSSSASACCCSSPRSSRPTARWPRSRSPTSRSACRTWRSSCVLARSTSTRTRGGGPRPRRLGARRLPLRDPATAAAGHRGRRDARLRALVRRPASSRPSTPASARRRCRSTSTRASSSG